MSKYIKSFDTAADMQAYFETASEGYYLFKDNSGEEGIGTSLTSGKRIVSAYKKTQDKYLTFTAEEANSTIKYIPSNATTAEYSLDGGNTWTDAVDVTITLANVGDSVKYRGIINGEQSWRGYGHFEMTGKIAASGSVMSMCNNNPDDTVITYNSSFNSLFQDCSSLTSAPELPATTLTEGCYQKMFYGCSSLTTAPELNVTNLTKNCYAYMFRNCSALTTAPELPATTLAYGCYSYMFYGCTSLTTAPALPATTLADVCYYYMFQNCTSLTTAPALPATTLADICYGNMFYGCSSLTSVTHHITSWSTSNATNWLSGVAASGTVTCPADSTIPANNTSGIPENWTRVDL